MSYEVKIETSKGLVIANIKEITDLAPLLLQHPTYTFVKLNRVDEEETINKTK